MSSRWSSENVRKSLLLILVTGSITAVAESTDFLDTTDTTDTTSSQSTTTTESSTTGHENLTTVFSEEVSSLSNDTSFSSYFTEIDPTEFGNLTTESFATENNTGPSENYTGLSENMTTSEIFVPTTTSELFILCDHDPTLRCHGEYCNLETDAALVNSTETTESNLAIKTCPLPVLGMFVCITST